MTRAILDTDIVTLLREGHPTVAQRFLETEPGDIFVTVITVEEQLTGWYSFLRQAKSPERVAEAYDQLARSVAYFARLPILSLDMPAIARFRALRAMKLNVGPMDLKIAAIALEVGYTLVTRNVRDFRRVPGLVVEDWSI